MPSNLSSATEPEYFTLVLNPIVMQFLRAQYGDTEAINHAVSRIVGRPTKVRVNRPLSLWPTPPSHTAASPTSPDQCVNTKPASGERE